MGDPSTSLRVTMVSLSFRAPAVIPSLSRNPIGFALCFLVAAISGGPFDFAQGDNRAAVIPNECEESRRETAWVGGPFDYAQGDNLRDVSTALRVTT